MYTHDDDSLIDYDAIFYYLPLVLQSEERTFEDFRKAFFAAENSLLH